MNSGNSFVCCTGLELMSSLKMVKASLMSVTCTVEIAVSVGSTLPGTEMLQDHVFLLQSLIIVPMAI